MSMPSILFDQHHLFAGDWFVPFPAYHRYQICFQLFSAFFDGGYAGRAENDHITLLQISQLCIILALY